MTGDDRDLRYLRMLDPAHSARPEAGLEPAAQALLERVLAEPRGTAPKPQLLRMSDRRLPRARRWVLVGAAAAAVTAGLVILPPWGGPESAFATWSAVPEEMPAARLDDLDPACWASLGDSFGAPAGERELVLAEERGRITFVVTVRAGKIEHCLLVDGAFSSAGSTSGLGIPAELAPTAVHTFMAAGGGHGLSSYTAVTGRVGRDVVGVEVHPRGRLEDPGALPGGELPESVEATISHGYYGAWWPGMTLEGHSDLELTLHLADGSVVEGVSAFDHEG